ncbi:MAG: 2OG-Fe(II) oxygenase [Hydrogenophaga sp.]|uniref:2OG-Fe(II) oxygenase n=1 Tax=Hydrogenophaga sp. TaxID=1904254 RepID=UPI003D9B9E50
MNGPSAMGQTITAELRRWLREQIDAGVDHATLLDALVQAGWALDLAERAIRGARHEHGARVIVVPQAPAERRVAVPAIQVGPSSREVLVGGRAVRVVASLNLPRVVVLAGLLSDGECDALIDAARPRLARSLTVQTRTGGEELNPDRTSDGMFFNRGETELVRRIEARIAALVNWPVENGEGMQVLHYRAGAEYKPHYDYFDPAEPGTPTILRRGGQRVGTLVMYLNHPVRGGGTVFPDAGFEVMPQRGHAVFFSYDQPSPATRTLHGGAPVIEGEKWIATKWLSQREFT